MKPWNGVSEPNISSLKVKAASEVFTVESEVLHLAIFLFSSSVKCYFFVHFIVQWMNQVLVSEKSYSKRKFDNYVECTGKGSMSWKTN